MITITLYYDRSSEIVQEHKMWMEDEQVGK